MVLYHIVRHLSIQKLHFFKKPVVIGKKACFLPCTFIPMIIGEMKRYLRDNNTIRVSRSMRDLAYRALQARDILTKEKGSVPSVDEILKYINRNEEVATKEEVVNAMEAIMEPISLFEPLFSDGGSGDTLYVMDQLGDPENSDEAWLENIALKEAIRHLEKREQKILDLRFYRGKTQTEIASELGISQAQVSRLEKGALERIRREI